MAKVLKPVGFNYGPGAVSLHQAAPRSPDYCVVIDGDKYEDGAKIQILGQHVLDWIGHFRGLFCGQLTDKQVLAVLVFGRLQKS